MSSLSLVKALEPPTFKFLNGELTSVEFLKRVRAVIEDQAQNLPSQIAFSNFMTKLVQNALELLNYADPKETMKHKIAGLIIFDCLIDINDEVMPERKIEICNHICKVLESDRQSLPVVETILKTATGSIGHFARVATNAEVEFLQNFCFPLAQKLVSNNRSESNRMAGVLILCQLSQNAPNLMFAKRKVLFGFVWEIVNDSNKLIRTSATNALESCLQVIAQREGMSDYIRAALRQVDAGFSSNNNDKAIGSLLILHTIISGAVISITELHNILRQQGVQVQDIIWKVLQRKDTKDPEIRTKIVEMIPTIAGAFSTAYLQPNNYTSPTNFLNFSIKHLTDSIQAKRDRSGAYMSLGRLFQSLSSYYRTSPNVHDIVQVICAGFKDPFCYEALSCLGMVVNISTFSRRFIDEKVIQSMFRGGLSQVLVDNLKIIIKHAPNIRDLAQRLLREYIGSILSNHAVHIDEIVSRPISMNKINQSNKIGSASTSYLWSSSGNGLFGNNSRPPESTISENTVSRQEDDLVFALKVLSIAEFFPKQQRERSINTEEEQTKDLLSILKDSVIRYMDDFNPDIRKAAVQACSVVLDIIVPVVDTDSADFSILYQVLDRLLIMGVGDDCDDIRVLVFQSITPSMDHAVSLTDNVHCLIEALNDENLQVRSAAMTVLSRVAHYDTLHVMPVVRLALKRLISALNSTHDLSLKQESVQILQALVRGSDSLIVPYVQQIIAPLLALLSDPSSEVVVSALSTIGELAVASPASVREHLDDLAPRLIEALNDSSSLAKQETAVVAMGKLVSSLAMVTDDPFKRYSGLFNGLVKAVQNADNSSSELRLQAIKTLGLLGVADFSVYHKYLTSTNAGIVVANEDAAEEEAKKESSAASKTPEGKVLSKIEKYYFSVVIRSLMNVLRDSSLTYYHQTASNIAIKAFRLVGQQGESQLPEMLRGVLFRLYQPDSGSSTREALLDHVISLIYIMGKLIRTHIPELVQLLVNFFDAHTSLCLDVLEALSCSVSIPDFHGVFQEILPTIVQIIDEECGSSGPNSGELASDSDVTSVNVSTYLKSTASTAVSKLPPAVVNTSAKNSYNGRILKVLSKFVIMSQALGEYKRSLIIFCIKILDSFILPGEVRKQALCTVIHLANETDLQEYAGRIIHPLLRLLNTSDSVLIPTVFTALSLIVCRLGTGYIPYIIPVRRKIKSFLSRDGALKSSKIEEYESLVARLLKERPLPLEPSDITDIMPKVGERGRSRGNTRQNEPSFAINIQTLETAWALADRSNAGNLIEWMRRLMIELIRQSPSPVIRYCALLAKTHRPLAEELFNISFHAIWEELFASQSHDVLIDIPLINGMELALQSPQIPQSITISLLNLAEFMEMQDRPLPLNVVLLAQQAQAANMFAKCLRYREVEFASKNLTPTFECIDALITVNNQLGLSDRAIGILRYVRQEYQYIEIQPQWLEKLCRWEDAYKAYQQEIQSLRDQLPNETPVKSEKWMNCELGRLRSLRALGEYTQLEKLAKTLKDQIKRSDEINNFSSWASLSQVRCLGAKASWMLGKWDLMEEFIEGEVRPESSKDVLLEQNISFYQAILAIHHKEYSKASTLIGETRNALSGSISSLLSESYSRAYKAMVTMQILAEMDEVVDYQQMVEKINFDVEALKNPDLGQSAVKIVGIDAKLSSDKISPAAVDLVAKKSDLIRKWRARLKWAPRDVEVYRQILGVHTLVAEPKEDLDSWIELAALCRKEGMFTLCAFMLCRLGAPLQQTPELGFTLTSGAIDAAKVNDRVLFSTLQYLWSTGEKTRALSELTTFLKTSRSSESVSGSGSNTSASFNTHDANAFRVKCLLKCANWMRHLEQGDVHEILQILLEARDLAKDEYSVWHAWAVANFDQLKKADSKEKKTSEEYQSLAPVLTQSFTSPPRLNPVIGQHSRSPAINLMSPNAARHQGVGGKFPYSSSASKKYTGAASLLTLMSMQQADKVTPFVTEAIKGFVRSIVLGQGQPVANLLQDTLRLITVWFSYGTKKGVLPILEEQLEKVSPDNWLSVVPQLIARIHIKTPEISGLLRKLLSKVAAVHPQPLVWPISVAINTNDAQQRSVATELLLEMRKNKKQLVEEATMVSRELMKVAITPHEIWYDGLEQAANCYLENRDIPGMVAILKDLHDTMNDQASQQQSERKKPFEGFSDGAGKIGFVSLRDVSFRHNYGKALQDAQFWFDQFRNSGKTVDLHQAWEAYQAVFKRVKGQITALKKLELHHVSQSLTSAVNLSLAVPGTYTPGVKDICITGFSPTVHVIASKQRPRRMSMFGSDGKQYQFLLKGHEDLRQDERVMQLFGLINVCLSNDRITYDRGLNIVRYSVLPLSNNSGLIGWVENCDTINQLVKTYREIKDIRLIIEVKLLQAKSLNYDKLPLMQKVEIFKQVLAETTGEDLAKMLWLNSKTSDVWIERRAHFIKSLAVMSMAGYILGLGDRHPSNLMIDRVSGQVVHIDFGDCFEITTQRSKYPEIVPFRLTRMMVNCMESAGVQGTYRMTCERVMRVLRDNRDSLMAMLEAFVYDPLISWRLLVKPENEILRVTSDDPSDKPRSPVEQMTTIALMSGESEDIPSDHSPKRMASSTLIDARRAIGGPSLDKIAADDSEPLQENLNARALDVINRIQAKLTGRDFIKDDDDAEDFTIEQQVDRLIKEATSVENLCQLFTGWCPMW